MKIKCKMHKDYKQKKTLNNAYTAKKKENQSEAKKKLLSMKKRDLENRNTGFHKAKANLR